MPSIFAKKNLRSSKLAKGLELVVLLPQRGAVVGLEDVEGRERLGPAPGLGFLDGHGEGRPVHYKICNAIKQIWQN